MVKLVYISNQSRFFLDDMKNVYRMNWKDTLKICTGKLRTYALFKKEFILENYVLQFPLSIRRNLSKLRISAHNLAIETGRYSKTKNKNDNYNKRLSFHCKNIESEFHLIFECNLYLDERKIFADCVEDMC